MIGAQLLFFRFLPQRGFLGHDYSHYFARLLIGADHFWKNGFQIPHFSPYLCGGVPFHADPQQIYYSLPQFLAFFWEVLPATFFSFGVFYFLGYWGMWKVCRVVFLFENRVSHFVALLFLLNGFSFNHLFVGHITHLPFLLAPWLLYFLFLKEPIFFSLIILYCLYSGALHVLVVFVFMVVLLFPILISQLIREKQGRVFLIFLLSVFCILLLMGSGKLYASYRYSSLFFMHRIDISGRSLYALLMTYLWFNPFNTPMTLPFTHLNLGSWEYTAAISRFTLAVSLGGALLALKRLPVVAASTGLLALCTLGIASGSFFNEKLPFLNHYHNPIKILGSFIVPVLLLSGFALHALVKEVKVPDSVFLMMGLVVCLEFFISSEFLIRTPHALGFRYPGFEFASIRSAGGLPPVRRVIDGELDDYSAMKGGLANLSCYEPLFGYRLESFHPKIQVGSSQLTHPGCLLYPKELKCEPWMLLKPGVESERFSSGHAMGEWVPRSQDVLNRINAISFLFVMSLVILKLWNSLVNIQLGSKAESSCF